MKIKCLDSGEDSLNFGDVYNTGDMYVSIEMPDQYDIQNSINANVFIGKTEAQFIIDHLKTQFDI